MRTIAFTGDHALTQSFGVNSAAYQRFGLAGHNGIDFGLPQGTELYAPEDGAIVEAYHDVGGYGLTTYLGATSGRGWRHGHLWRLDVTAGEIVRQGQRLGLSGNTGNSTGPHLHLGMRPPNPNPNNGFGGYVDPLPTLERLLEEQMQGIIDELNGQVAALRAELDGANGINTELGKQVNSLQWLLGVSQKETADRDAVIAQLQQAGPAAEIANIAVRFADGREVVR